jgi:hypothetical protein
MTPTTDPTPPPTAKKRGRPPGVTTELGHTFMGWPFDEWIKYNAPDAKTAISDANHIRNLAWRKGVGVAVLSDREDETALHIRKYSKENGTQD